LKSFKQHISETTALMDLINKYDNPYEFLSAVMKAIADGRIILKTRGAANAREVVAVWNKVKTKKIKVSEAIDYLTEASKGFIKGWVHKSGTITDTTIYGKYHIMQVATNLRKFGLNKNKMLKIISDAYPDSNEGWPEDLLDDLQTGRVDNDPYIEEYLQEKGWCMFVIDKTHGSISGWDERSTKPAAKALDDKYLPYETRKDLKLFEVKLANGKDKYITSKFDWYLWLDGKKVADNRTDIGSTMAQFREEMDWAKETGYLKQTSITGSGGKGGSTEYAKGERAMIHHTDKNNKKWKSMIPPVQYKPAKDTRALKKYVDAFKKDIIANGGKVKKVEMGK